MALKLDMSRFFGVTHEDDGQLSAKVPRLVKVSIGLPAGKDIHVLIGPSGKWSIKVGEKRLTCDTKEEAIAAYREHYPKAPTRKYPKKIAYFTFTRSGGDGIHHPDFDLIERFGSLPTELDIAFTTNNRLQSFDRGMKMYSKSKLLCYGNGRDALRSITLARSPEEKKLAEEAKDSGEKYFPIINGCRTRGCAYFQKGECKSNGALRFQLKHAPMLGGDCYFVTTSQRSIDYIEAAIEQVYERTSDARGIFMRLQIRPYTGDQGVAYAVALILPAESQRELTLKLQEGGNPRQLTGSEPVPIPEEEAARVFNAEFVGEESDPDEGQEEEPQPTTGRMTLEALTQEQRDTILQLARKRGLNKARIDALLGDATGTIEEFIAGLAA